MKPYMRYVLNIADGNRLLDGELTLAWTVFSTLAFWIAFSLNTGVL